MKFCHLKILLLRKLVTATVCHCFETTRVCPCYLLKIIELHWNFKVCCLNFLFQIWATKLGVLLNHGLLRYIHFSEYRWRTTNCYWEKKGTGSLPFSFEGFITFAMEFGSLRGEVCIKKLIPWPALYWLNTDPKPK